MPNKDFVDHRVQEKQRQIADLKRKAKSAKKALKKSKRQTQQTLESTTLGWTTREGKGI